jgi:hypothetical protein
LLLNNYQRISGDSETCNIRTKASHCVDRSRMLFLLLQRNFILEENRKWIAQKMESAAVRQRALNKTLGESL